jgi:putative transposase
MERLRNKYRVASARLQHWDYRWSGAYFITLCTYNREPYFGEILNGKMQMSHVGIIADILWHQIPHHAQNVELGAFVVMPNHIHGIIIINNDNADSGAVGTGHALAVETRHALSLRLRHGNSPNATPDQPQTIGQQRFQNIGKNSISSIVGSYKSAVTKHANRLALEFQWQSRFHDHIIRDDESYQKITEYIISNPANWQEDKFKDIQI